MNETNQWLMRLNNKPNNYTISDLIDLQMEIKDNLKTKFPKQYGEDIPPRDMEMELLSIIYKLKNS